jgi:hypothetical protein
MRERATRWRWTATTASWRRGSVHELSDPYESRKHLASPTLGTSLNEYARFQPWSLSSDGLLVSKVVLEWVNSYRYTEAALDAGIENLNYDCKMVRVFSFSTRCWTRGAMNEPRSYQRLLLCVLLAVFHSFKTEAPHHQLTNSQCCPTRSPLCGVWLCVRVCACVCVRARMFSPSPSPALPSPNLSRAG